MARFSTSCVMYATACLCTRIGISTTNDPWAAQVRLAHAIPSLGRTSAVQLTVNYSETLSNPDNAPLHFSPLQYGDASEYQQLLVFNRSTYAAYAPGSGVASSLGGMSQAAPLFTVSPNSYWTVYAFPDTNSTSGSGGCGGSGVVMWPVQDLVNGVSDVPATQNGLRWIAADQKLGAAGWQPKECAKDGKKCASSGGVLTPLLAGGTNLRYISTAKPGSRQLQASHASESAKAAHLFPMVSCVLGSFLGCKHEEGGGMYSVVVTESVAGAAQQVTLFVDRQPPFESFMSKWWSVFVAAGVLVLLLLCCAVCIRRRKAVSRQLQ